MRFTGIRAGITFVQQFNRFSWSVKRKGLWNIHIEDYIKDYLTLSGKEMWNVKSIGQDNLYAMCGRTLKNGGLFIFYYYKRDHIIW